MAGVQRPGRFGPAELDAADLGPGTEATLLEAARELERLALAEDVGPAPDFTDRVMAAVSREPAPRPVAAVIGAARRRSPLAALAALGDLWRVAFTGGRPFASRFPAMVLVVLLVLGSVGAGALGAGALAGLLGRTPEATPALSPSPVAAPSPLVESTPELSASPSPSASPAASASPEPSDTPGSSSRPEPSPPRGASASPAPTATPRAVARPPTTPRPTERPTPTVEPTPTPSPSETPSPTATPRPTETPDSPRASTPGPTPTPGHSGD